MKIGERLYNLRKEKGLSQEELAEILKVSRQTVSKWETGESNPDFDKIEPLCEIYDITADELIRGIKKENIEVLEEIKEEDNSEALKKYRKWKKYEGLTLAGCILLYFISIVWIIFVEETGEKPFVSDRIMISVFLLIVGVATSIITCYYVSLRNIKKEIKKDVEENNEEDNKYKDIDAVTAVIFCAIYLLVSFITMRWSITWILWLIYVIFIKIIHIVLDEKESKNEK